MVAAVRHHHVPRGLGGDGEALGSVQRAATSVHVGQEGAELVKHLDPEHEDKMTDETFPWTTALALNTHLEFPQSATRMLSWLSTATPVGALN